ncbi:MAG: ribonuclease III [Mucilaginibacter polytrichastri]|nr:ribonuclease III [Mucilaginibacter polytrichastri]
MPVSRFYKLYFSSQKQYIRQLKNVLGFVPGNVRLYKLAFTHKSVAEAVKSKNGVKNSNERLEFLGDAVLGSVVAEVLFKRYPYQDEGFLTELRSKIVSRVNLNLLAKKLGFQELVQYDTRMVNTTRQGSLLGDAFEALVGAIYLDKGYDFTRKFLINRIIKQHIDIAMLEKTETNFKSKLIEWCQRHSKDITFDVVANGDGESPRLFTVQVSVDGEVMGSGKEFNKKTAEKLAAEKACEALAI